MGNILSYFVNNDDVEYEKERAKEEWGEEYIEEEDEEEEEEEDEEEGNLETFAEEERELLSLRINQSKTLEKLIEELSQYDKIRNPSTLQRVKSAWEKENFFLNKLTSGKLQVTYSRLSSSNFEHLYALVTVLSNPQIKDVCDVALPVKFNFEGLFKLII